MRINDVQKIHFIGIGGIGVSAAAKLMALEGKVVTGSDHQETSIGLRMSVKIGHDEKNLASDADLVVYSLAIPPKNPELQKAKKLKIPTFSYPEFLGILMKEKIGIAVAGTNGKSTTTAMIGFILERAGLDPTVIVGSKLKAFGGNARLGKSKYFIAEADEYKRGFLNLHPQIAVITNIEEDHLDYYKDLDDIIDAFSQFVSPVDNYVGGSTSHIIANRDNENVVKIIKDLGKREIITFGQDSRAVLRAIDIKFSDRTNFKVNFKGKSLGEFELRLPGIFNVYNALGAVGAALHLGVPVKKINKALLEFSGLWRRFERVGKCRQAEIISDYAHHPTAIKKTIEASGQFFPKKRLMVVFQPHQHNRTKKLFKDFTSAFDRADLIILSEIFDVAGREIFDQDISSKDLAKAIRKRGKIVFYGQNLKETKDLVVKNIKANDVVLVMGAGDIYKLADYLVKN